MEVPQEGHSQGGVAPRRAVPPNRFHRDEHEQNPRERGPVLQQAGHGRAIHQGREACAHLDEALVCEVCVQPGAPGPVRAGVKPWQLPAPLRSSKRGVTLVFLKHSAKAHKDWGQDSLPLQDDRISDGGGRCSGKAVPVDALKNSSPGEGMRESARPESVKDEGMKNDKSTCGTTVSRQR